MSDIGAEREPILPQITDRSEWTPKEQLAFAWVLDSVALEPVNEALNDAGLDKETEQNIRSAVASVRTTFISYICELTGTELTTEEFAQVMWEIGRTKQEIGEQEAAEDLK